uniref:Tc1-like transposase DDE domain-containing protein n=1 Tax=Lates calcarifer TaxID=8187 RepID=A0A4W6FH10_LATCA
MCESNLSLKRSCGLMLKNKWVFQKHNNPKLTSKRAPAQSPHLNPIENLCGNIKNTVSDTKPTTAKELCKVVKSSWAKIPVYKCQNLVYSMQHTCEAVLKKLLYYSNKYF